MSGFRRASGSLLQLGSQSLHTHEGSGMVASLITMTDCPSVGISQMVIVGCVGYKEKEEGHFSLGFPLLSLLENSQRLGSDWLERKEMSHDLARRDGEDR